MDKNNEKENYIIEENEDEETISYDKDSAKMPRGYFLGMLKGNFWFVLIFIIAVIIFVVSWFKLML